MINRAEHGDSMIFGFIIQLKRILTDFTRFWCEHTSKFFSSFKLALGGCQKHQIPSGTKTSGNTLDYSNGSSEKKIKRMIIPRFRLGRDERCLDFLFYFFCGIILGFNFVVGVFLCLL